MSDNFTKAISIMNNAILRRWKIVNVPRCRLVELFLYYLRDKGFIDSFFVPNSTQCIVYLKYIDNACFLKKIVRISKPSKRVYISYRHLRIKKKWRQLRHGVLSTSSGLISSFDAYLVKKKGGELLVDLWF